MHRTMMICLPVLLGLSLSPPVQASYTPECRELAVRLATAPGELRIGELDVLKTCLSALQRGIMAGEPAPAGRSLAAECPPPVPVPAAECPVCPAAVACPKVDRADRGAEDPSRQRFIPRY